MQRIAVFGDVHGNIAALDAVLVDVAGQGVEAMYCLGDLGGYGARPNEVISTIRDRNIPTIMGNYDDGVGFDREECGCAYRDAGEQQRGQQSLMWTRSVTNAENKAFLRELPFDLRLTLGEDRVRLVHGSPRRINEYLFEDRDAGSLERIASTADCDVLVFGHTHKPWQRQIRGTLLINAGSVGKPKDGDLRACWVLLESAQGEGVSASFRRVPYDIASAASAIRSEQGLPDQFARDLEHA